MPYLRDRHRQGLHFSKSRYRRKQKVFCTLRLLEAEIEQANKDNISKMPNDIKRGIIYTCQNVMQGWTKVLVLDYDEDRVFVRLLDKNSFWYYDRDAIIKREVFIKKYINQGG